MVAEVRMLANEYSPYNEGKKWTVVVVEHEVSTAQQLSMYNQIG